MSGYLRPAALLLLFFIASTASAQTTVQSDSAAKAAVSGKSLPLISTRTLEMTVDEGTWISLDVSPDGKSILFELLGDLYTLPITGGAATRITSGQGYDMQPRYSPDGKRIVFVSDRDGAENVWIADANGSNARALTTTERENYVSPIWTPDSKYVVATKGSQLWLYHTDGGSGVQMSGRAAAGAPAGAPAAAASHHGATFSNDPRYVWVNVRGLPGGGV